MSFGRERSVPDQICPGCGGKFDRATCVQGDVAPKPGDITLCIHCGSVCFFTAELQLRLPDELEQLQLEHGPNWLLIQKLRAGIAIVQHNRKSR